MNTINKYLSEHPEVAEQFLKNNESLIQEIKNRFAAFHENGDLFSRYLLAITLNTIVQDEGNLSKQILKAEIQRRGVAWIGDPVEC